METRNKIWNINQFYVQFKIFKVDEFQILKINDAIENLEEKVRCIF